MTWSISSAVVGRPRLKRRLLRASSGERPIAISTCDGSTAPDEHAAPVEQAIPCRSSAITSASPPAAGNEMFEVLDTRCARSPFTRASPQEREQRVFQAIAQRSDARAIRHQVLARQFRRLSQANDARNIFCARTAIAFVMTAVELRLEGRARSERRARRLPWGRKFCARKWRASPRRGGSRRAASFRPICTASQ